MFENGEVASQRKINGRKKEESTDDDILNFNKFY
jgi:hypothetical protein